MRHLTWLGMLLVLALAAPGEALAQSGGKKQNFGSSTRDCKPPMSSADYFRCGFGGGGRR